MKELELKYGCNPNQKPSRIFMEDGELPIQVLCENRDILTPGRFQRLAAGQGIKGSNGAIRRRLPSSTFPRQEQRSVCPSAMWKRRSTG